MPVKTWPKEKTEEWRYQLCPAMSRKHIESDRKCFLMRTKVVDGRVTTRSEFLYRDGWHNSVHTSGLKYMSSEDGAAALFEHVGEQRMRQVMENAR